MSYGHKVLQKLSSDRVQEAVGGSMSFSLTGRKFRLGEVKKAVQVFAAAFMQSWFQSTGAQAMESLDIDKAIQSLDIAYGKKELKRTMESVLSTTKVKRHSDARYTLDAGMKKKANRAIQKITATNYFEEIPLDDIIRDLDILGIIVLMEDGSPFVGFLVGAEGTAFFDLGDKNMPAEQEWGTQYEKYTNASLNLQWYKMSSNKYEVTAYIA